MRALRSLGAEPGVSGSRQLGGSHDLGNSEIVEPAPNPPPPSGRNLQLARRIVSAAGLDAQLRRL